MTGNSTITGTLTALTGITSTGTASFADVTVSGTFGLPALTLTQLEATGPALVFNPSSGNPQVHTKNATTLSFDNVAETVRLLQLNWSTARTHLGPTAGVDVVVGTSAALATAATTWHFYVPFSAGTPTGVPALAGTGYIALQYDTSANKLWAYNGAWKAVALA